MWTNLGIPWNDPGVEEVDRAFLDGDLTAASCERLLSKVTEQRHAAEAERDRLAGHVRAREAELLTLDAEDDVRERWERIQESVAGVATSDNLDALRAELLATFESVDLTRHEHGGFFLSPSLRLGAIPGGWDDMCERAALRLSPAGGRTIDECGERTYAEWKRR